MPFRSLGLARNDWITIGALLITSRLLYGLLGLEFDSNPFPGYMQFIDKELLSSRLIESLYYYHANPPLLNLVAGVAYKLTGDGIGWFFCVLFHCLGVLIAVCVYTLSWRLSDSRVAAAIATGLLVFSPSFVLYENWLMYSFPTVALVTLCGLCIYQYFATLRLRWCVALFVTLALLLLTRSLFHLAWMLLIIAIVLFLSPGNRKKVLVAAALPVLVVVSWYGKNYYHFGNFGASTWLGLGLSNISTLVPTRAELQPLVEDGRLTRFALVSRYRQIDQLFSIPQPETGIPVLDQVRKSDGDYNFNNARIVTINQYYTSDAVTVVREFPLHYAVALVISNRLYFSPSSMNVYFSARNRAAARPMERLLNPVLYGTGADHEYLRQPHFGFRERMVLEVNTSLPLIVVWFSLIGYGYMKARKTMVSVHASRDPRAILAGFIVLTALYLYVVSTAFELAENYRYRFNVEPLMFVLAAAALTDIVRKVRAKVTRMRSLPA
jgi:hypothetical protein